ncbi:hypothetical protein [Rosenbergiella australiborealis]|nr:hypothetical protein [Rosenbergiella australiborealis]
MATSPSHKLGQLLGNMLESIFIPLLQGVADRHNMYLDVVGQPREGRKGKKITWADSYGSTHDLDIVFEYGGSSTQLGRPVAFIESAWRRYTKHSKNKAQEIQGAILPIADKYYIECPFKGAILAGEFTEPSLKQLANCGFHVLYIPYIKIVSAFSQSGIDMSFDESTSEVLLSQKVSAIENISQEQLLTIKRIIIDSNRDSISTFINVLEGKISKSLKKLIITPLYGNNYEFNSLNDAKDFITSYNTQNSATGYLAFNNFLIYVVYMNDDHIKAEFSSSIAAINFLNAVII